MLEYTRRGVERTGPFYDLIALGPVYVDRTAFLKQWYDHGDKVLLLLRPPGFCKTTILSCIDYYFSTQNKGRLRKAGAPLFDGLTIWQHEDFRALQGTMPVISVSLSDCTGTRYQEMAHSVGEAISAAFRQHLPWLRATGALGASEIEYLTAMAQQVPTEHIPTALTELSRCIYTATQQRALILLDDYDIPLIVATAAHFPFSELMRALLLTTFRDNPYLERGILTGVIEAYPWDYYPAGDPGPAVDSMQHAIFGTAFGYAEDEVERLLQAYALFYRKDAVRRWYGGYRLRPDGESLRSISEPEGKELLIERLHPASVNRFLQTDRFRETILPLPLQNLCAFAGRNVVRPEVKKLLSGGSVELTLTGQRDYSLSIEEPEQALCLLYAAGLLHIDQASHGHDRYTLRIANEQSRAWFRSLSQF